jgi:hypothetical protein
LLKRVIDRSPALQWFTTARGHQEAKHTGRTAYSSGDTQIQAASEQSKVQRCGPGCSSMHCGSIFEADAQTEVQSFLVCNFVRASTWTGCSCGQELKPSALSADMCGKDDEARTTAPVQWVSSGGSGDSTGPEAGVPSGVRQHAPHGQCQQILGNGHRCQNDAAQGCGYCWRHRD